MPTWTKLRTYAQKSGIIGRRSSSSWPWGTFSSRTITVMMIAITPSLNASSRSFVTATTCGGRRRPRHESSLAADSTRISHGMNDEREGGLVRWQWGLYPDNHRSRTNLLIHLVTFPVFPIGNVLVVAGAVRL